MSGSEAEDVAEDIADYVRDTFDDIEAGTALLGIGCLLIYGFGIVEDEAVLMLGLTMVSGAAGYDQFRKR